MNDVKNPLRLQVVLLRSVDEICDLEERTHLNDPLVFVTIGGDRRSLQGSRAMRHKHEKMRVIEGAYQCDLDLTDLMKSSSVLTAHVHVGILVCEVVYRIDISKEGTACGTCVG